jgi:hypothetical protein
MFSIMCADTDEWRPEMALDKRKKKKKSHCPIMCADTDEWRPEMALDKRKKKEKKKNSLPNNVCRYARVEARDGA